MRGKDTFWWCLRCVGDAQRAVPLAWWQVPWRSDVRHVQAWQVQQVSPYQDARQVQGCPGRYGTPCDAGGDRLARCKADRCIVSGGYWRGWGALVASSRRLLSPDRCAPKEGRRRYQLLDGYSRQVARTRAGGLGSLAGDHQPFGAKAQAGRIGAQAVSGNAANDYSGASGQLRLRSCPGGERACY